MAETFDPYRKWLGIPPEEQPPNHYRLLGIGLFEADADVIEGAADRQMAHIQRHQLGQYAALSQRILNELSAAKLCLLMADRKDAYDRVLRKQLAADAAPAPPPSSPAPPVATPPAAAPPKPVPKAPVEISRRQSPAKLAPVEVVRADEDDMNLVEPAAISELPQARRSTGKRRAATAQKSSARKAGTKKSGSKQSGPNLMILGGSIAAAVVVIAIIAIAANRDRSPQPVAHVAAQPTSKPSSTPSTPAEKPAPNPETKSDPVPVTPPTESIKPEPAPKPAAPAVQVVPPKAAPDANVLASGDVIDLLPLVKVSAKSAIGKWQKTKKGLTLLASKARVAEADVALRSAQ